MAFGRALAILVLHSAALGVKLRPRLDLEELREEGDQNADVEICRDWLDTLGPQESLALCRVVVGFQSLWDTFEADKMQEAINTYCKKDIDVEWALTNTSYYDMYGSNVGKRVRQFNGKLGGHFEGHFKPVAVNASRVDLQREGASLELHLPDRKFRKILKTSEEGYPESNLTNFQSDCVSCRAMMRLVVEKTAEAPGWLITRVEIVRLS